jgi:phage terminase small subunit
MTKEITKSPARPEYAAELNDQEWLFVEAYVDTLNGAQAAKRAGFKNPNVAAHRLRRRKHVADAISKAIAERAGAARSRIVEEISRLAFSNIGDVLSVEDGALVVKEHADLDRDTLSTVASIEEQINDKGYRTLRVKQHDRLAALTLLARISGMLINRQEISGPGGRPIEVDQTIDHSARIRSRLDEIAKRLPSEQPITIDVTPARQASPTALGGPAAARWAARVTHQRRSPLKSWCVAEGTEMPRVCPKWRVDAFKVFLGIKLPDPTRRQGEEVLDVLQGI